MGHVYFASDSLACVRDTRRLALETGWIWRETYAGIGTLAPVAGAQILLAFSRGGRSFPWRSATSCQRAMRRLGLETETRLAGSQTRRS